MRALAIAVTLLAGVVWAAVALPEIAPRVQALDDAWHDAVATSSPGLLGLAVGLAVLGGAWVTLPLRIGVAVWLWRAGRRQAFVTWTVTVVAAQAVALLGKLAYGRERPPDRMMETINSAFPSGHATNAAAIAVGLLLALAPRRRLAWGSVALVWMLLMAWSRTAVRMHWLSDVTGGLLAGTACALWAAAYASTPSTPSTEARPDRGTAG